MENSVKVRVGVLQRFGTLALTDVERKDFWKTCIANKRPEECVLRECVLRLTEMQVCR